jgi:hypothetical protein
MLPFRTPVNVKVCDACEAESVRVKPTVNGLLVNVLGWVGSTALRPMLDVRLMSEDAVPVPLVESKKMTLLVPLSAAKTSGMRWVL